MPKTKIPHGGRTKKRGSQKPKAKPKKGKKK